MHLKRKIMQYFLKLNNDQKIPIIGLGTYKSPLGIVKESIKYAINVGYRHFDCAWRYGNEHEIGEALNEIIKNGTVKREDLFITTKIWNTFHEREKVVPALKKSLNKLNLDYVDLYLIHWPMGFKETNSDEIIYSDVDYLETWSGMEDCVKLNLTKSIGLSNFNSLQIDRILNNCKIPPTVNQVEVNPNFNQKKLIEFCKKRNIIITGYCPLGRIHSLNNNSPQPTIFDPKIAEIGRKYNKTPAQIVLNYLVSLGISVIPKSVSKERIQENIEIFDFKLDSDDIAYLESCNKNQRVFTYEKYADHKYFSFNVEF